MFYSDQGKLAAYPTTQLVPHDGTTQLLPLVYAVPANQKPLQNGKGRVYCRALSFRDGKAKKAKLDRTFRYWSFSISFFDFATSEW